MPTFFQDEINVDIIQHTPRIAPVLGRANSPTNGQSGMIVLQTPFKELLMVL